MNVNKLESGLVTLQEKAALDPVSQDKAIFTQGAEYQVFSQPAGITTVDLPQLPPKLIRISALTPWHQRSWINIDKS
jgi:hypothetical protein